MISKTKTMTTMTTKKKMPEAYYRQTLCLALSAALFLGAALPANADDFADDSKEKAERSESTENSVITKIRDSADTTNKRDIETEKSDDGEKQVLKRTTQAASAAVTQTLPSTASMFDRLMNAGLKASAIRADEEAQSKFLEAIKEAKKLFATPDQLIAARLGLADAYFHEEKYIAAGETYQQCIDQSKKLHGTSSREYAHALHGAAAVAFHQGKIAKAEPLIKEALEIRKRLLDPHDHDLGESYVIRGAIAGAKGWSEEAHADFQKGLEILEQSPGTRSMDLADALRDAAMFYHSIGKRNRSRDYFERSYSIKDKSVNFEQPPKIQGSVRFKWEDGSPRSQEFADADFPLKYLATNQVRVACTIVDCWEILGVLICITNIGDKRVDLGLGKANLTELAEPHKPFLLIPENTFDYRRRERTMWDYTYNRPWLANIQKTRVVRGFVPAKGHDMFRGPNIFGIYGKWGGTERILPPEKFMLNRSPEELEEQAQAVIEEDLVRSRHQGAFGLVPVTLEPFESRTGQLFYLNTRKEEVMITVPIGNTIFTFPFHAPKRRFPG
ncbi:MAG: hypothetical protein DKT66_25905 [Candidatus Melainabacteria bacterium]|nr:MAG: hypothetical protein DKT66_25905 [Candidatus Melainabacteria bacterium]